MKKIICMLAIMLVGEGLVVAKEATQGNRDKRYGDSHRGGTIPKTSLR